MLRDAFGNADDQGNLGGERFFDASGGQWGTGDRSCLAQKMYTPKQY